MLKFTFPSCRASSNTPPLPSIRFYLDMSSVFTKQIPVSVRDLFLLSLRRAPAPHSNGHSSDSLRRLVLQRNTLKTALDSQDTLNRQSSLRRFSTDVSIPVSSESLPKQSSLCRHSQHTRAQSTLRRSRSAQDLAASSNDRNLAVSTREDILEDMWFEHVMEDLILDGVKAEQDSTHLEESPVSKPILSG